MVWAARRAATLMASTSARSSRACFASPISSPSWARMTSGRATSGPRALFRSCATPPARTLSASIRFVGRQSLLHAAFVQHARLNQLFPQPNALQGRGDLVAKRLVAVVPIGIAERDDAQQLVLERQRQDEEGSRVVVGQRGRRHQLAGRVVRVRLHSSSPSRRHIAGRNTSRRLAGHARQIGRADAGAGEALDQRAPQRRQIEGDGRLLSDAEQAQVVFVQQQAVLHLAGGGGQRDQVQSVEEDPLDGQARPAAQLFAQVADRAVKQCCRSLSVPALSSRPRQRLLESLAFALQLGAQRLEEAGRRRGAVREAGASSSRQHRPQGLEVLGRETRRRDAGRQAGDPCRYARRGRSRMIGGGRAAPASRCTGHRSSGELLLDRLHRPVRDLLERLRDGGERRVSQARQDEVVEAGDRDILGHAQAPLAQEHRWRRWPSRRWPRRRRRSPRPLREESPPSPPWPSWRGSGPGRDRRGSKGMPWRPAPPGRPRTAPALPGCSGVPARKAILRRP